MFADPLDFFQAPDAPNTSENRLERLERLSELGQWVLVSSAIEIIMAKPEVAPSDRLERLATMSRQASRMDSLRIERTIRIIIRARQAVAIARQHRQESLERLMLARNSVLRAKAALQIIRDRHRA